MRLPAALLAAVLAACTSGAGPSGRVGTSPSAPSAGEPPIVIPVVGAGAAGRLGSTFFEGMTLAADQVNDRGGVTGRPLRLEISTETGSVAGLPAALERRPPAVLVIGQAEDVAAFRTGIEAARTPVVLLGGDPYTARQMHRYLFQTSVPVRWQARILASYLLEDRREDLVALLVPPGPRGEVVGDAFASAFVGEGGRPPSRLRPDPQAIDAAAGADAVVVMLPPARARAVARSLAERPDPPRLVLPSEGFLVGGPLPPGTVLCAPYTWAGWADMIPRVHGFREAFAERFGRPPDGLEQEGYDTVMALAAALGRTGGRGGDALVRSLEGFRDETYASVPVRLGPDDHVLAEESHLGVFAVTDAGGAPAGEAFGRVPWRPVMRTFTTDGEKVNLLDRDKRIFFPFWRPKRPTPKYWRSGYGIVSRRSDPVH